MSRKDRLSVFGEQVGFVVTIESDTVRATGVPCLLKDGVPGACSIEKSCDPATGGPATREGGVTHAVRITTDQESDGRVYLADGTPLGNLVDTDGKAWSVISVKLGGAGSPQEDQSATDVVHRYAKQIVGAASAVGKIDEASGARSDTFKIPNTFEDRAAIRPVQNRIRGASIAIIGLGGTGSYVLDLVSKTPVSHIHLLDSDVVDWHTLMRAPSAPTVEEIESVGAGTLPKVTYYASKYAPLRHGIHAHPVMVSDVTMWREFLNAHPIDFAFVCIDQLVDRESPRQDAVYRALSETEIPFVDSGVSITIDGDAIRGAVTTSGYGPGSMEWTAIPNARVSGDVPGYRNVQLPEVNALAAALAVMEWRRRTGQYVSESTSFLHKLRIEGPSIRTAQASDEGQSP